jgi:hypothetical protein
MITPDTSPIGGPGPSTQPLEIFSATESKKDDMPMLQRTDSGPLVVENVTPKVIKGTIFLKMTFYLIHSAFII